MRTAPAELLNWRQARQDWLRETIECLVAIESPSTDKPAVDRCGAELSRRLESIGAAVDRLPREARGDHIRADFAGTGPRRPPARTFRHRLAGRSARARMPLREDAGRLHGPGVFDMKAGIAVSMLALRALHELEGRAIVPRVTMLWTTDEEVGSETSRAAIEAIGARALGRARARAVAAGRRGQDEPQGLRRVRAHGPRRVRARRPRSGERRERDSRARAPDCRHQRAAGSERGITFNVGALPAVSRTNVVADDARASIDVRVPTMEDAAAVEERCGRCAPCWRGRGSSSTAGSIARRWNAAPRVIRLVWRSPRGRRRAREGSAGRRDGRRVGREFYGRARRSYS